MSAELSTQLAQSAPETEASLIDAQDGAELYLADQESVRTPLAERIGSLATSATEWAHNKVEGFKHSRAVRVGTVALASLGLAGGAASIAKGQTYEGPNSYGTLTDVGPQLCDKQERERTFPERPNAKFISPRKLAVKQSIYHHYNCDMNDQTPFYQAGDKPAFRHHGDRDYELHVEKATRTKSGKLKWIKIGKTKEIDEPAIRYNGQIKETITIPKQKPRTRVRLVSTKQWEAVDAQGNPRPGSFEIENRSKSILVPGPKKKSTTRRTH